MSNASSSKGKKKTASAFQSISRDKGQPAALLQNLLAGADEVAERSFLGGGSPATPTPAQQATFVPDPAAPSAPQVAGETASVAEDFPAAPPEHSSTSQVPEPATPPPALADDARLPQAAPDHQADVSTAATGSDAAVPAAISGAPAQAATPSLPALDLAEASATPAAVDQTAPALEVEGETDSVTLVTVTPDPPASARRRPKGQRGPWAHRAVHESFAQAKIHSEKWQQHGFRIEPEVLTALKSRMARDRRTSKVGGLAMGHYLDAALRHAPTGVEDQIASAQQFLDERMGVVEKGRQSTYRVGPEAHTLMASLNQDLQEADYGRRGLYVVSAAIERLLRALDAEGPLPRPARRGTPVVPPSAP